MCVFKGKVKKRLRGGWEIFISGATSAVAVIDTLSFSTIFFTGLDSRKKINYNS